MKNIENFFLIILFSTSISILKYVQLNDYTSKHGKSL